MPYNNYTQKYLKVSSLVASAKNALETNVILYYRTFNQTWGNGGGIWAVPGGLYTANMLTKKVSVFYGKNEKVAVFVGDTLAYIVDKPNAAFNEDVRNQYMEYVSEAQDKYELTVEVFSKNK